jgi:hypothetical protein
MKRFIAVLFLLVFWLSVAHSAEPVKKTLIRPGTADRSVTFTCPPQTPVYVVRTNEYNQDGWQGASGGGKVTVKVLNHNITPDGRMYCDYEAPGSIGVSRNFPPGMTCKATANFSFSCAATN